MHLLRFYRFGPGFAPNAPGWPAHMPDARRRQELHAQVPRAELGIGLQLPAGAAPDDPALFDDVMPVGNLRQGIDVLVDDEYRLPFLLQFADALPDFFAYEGRQPFGGFVKNEQAGIGQQGARNGQHLLLAPGKLAPHGAASLFQAGKQPIRLGQVPRPRAPGRGDEVFFDAEVRGNVPALWHQAYAQAADAVWRHAGDGLPLENHLPRPRRDDTQQRMYGGGLAHAIAAQHGNHLTRIHQQGNAEQHAAVAVAGLKAFDPKHVGPLFLRPWFPGRLSGHRRCRGSRPPTRWR